MEEVEEEEEDHRSIHVLGLSIVLYGNYGSMEV